MKKYWRIYKKDGYKRCLEKLDVKQYMIDYLCNNIQFIIEEKEYIYIGYDDMEKKWLWSDPDQGSPFVEDADYQGSSSDMDLEHQVK